MKQAGKTKMSARVAGYYQVMQICQCSSLANSNNCLPIEHTNDPFLLLKKGFLMHRDQRFNPKAVPPFANQGGDNYMHLPVSSSFPGNLFPAADDLLPIYGVQFQPSEVCPRNFVIVDQTDHHSQIMFNPAIGYKFSAPNFNAPSSFIHESFMGKEDALDIKELSSWKEDSHDIDALLSLDEEDDGDDESDEDEVSTARTYGSSSPGSCSNYDHHYNSRSNVCSSVQKSFGGGSSSNSSEKKQLKMKRMVKALKGIVPGGEQMNTVTIIDEAVKYLKTLKVEAQKLGVGKLKDYYE
ncbi:unnamed protein product [Linum tenue]|uniref:BHLH domain-containing protein n=2 Tax=Linum tenue TaxID=586396 RepID=A0AAV0N123_9ROSI|nr:unnamed protein product [Linum tenue]